MFNFSWSVLKNLSSGYATRMYPVTKREPFPESRGELYNEIDKCIFCKKCQMVCPSVCISVDNKAATWTCDAFACVYCGYCVEACPVGCLHQKPKHRDASYKREVISMQGELKKKPKAEKVG